MSIQKIDFTEVADPSAKIKFSPTFGGIYVGAYSRVKIEWNAEVGVNGYNVYYSVFPLLRYKANDVVITATSYEFNLPLYPNNIVFYFWVSKIINSVETFINTEGETYDTTTERSFNAETISPIETSYVFPETKNINEQMKLLLTRIKADMQFMLQNDGTPCYVYLRRWGSDKPYGIPCPCTNNNDDNPDFTGRDRCNLCFGTGVIGGYYPPIEMFIRFNVMPSKEFRGVVYGLKVSQTYEAWSIPDPILRAEDLIVRKYDGERYLVKDVALSTQRSVATRQELRLDLLPMNDIRRIVSLDTINQALSYSSNPKYNPKNNEDF